MSSGLLVLLNEGLATSHVLCKTRAVSVLDSSLSSADVCTRLSASSWDAVKSDCKSVAKVALGVGAIYLGLRVASKWWRQRTKIRPVVTFGEDVLDHVNLCIEQDEANEEEVVEGNLMVGTIDIGIPRSLTPEVRLKRRHRSKPFITKVVHSAKNHFGGCPDSSKANVMAVSKFVYELCKEHNCLPHQTRLILSVAVPLVLSPDEYDLSSKALLNSNSLCENRAELERLKTIDGWLENLICHPLSTKAWRRALDNLCGLPDWKAFRLIS